MTYQFIDIASKIDAVFAHCLKNAGYTGVIRYLDASWGKSSKCITPFEAQQISGAGLDILLVFESCGGAQAPGCDTWGAEYFNNPSQGIFDAQHAYSQAKTVGYPEGHPIFFSVDYDARPEELASQEPYWLGVHDILKDRWPVGDYGSYRVCKYNQENRSQLVQYHWQTVAWSNGLWLPGAHVRQVRNHIEICGQYVDLDDSEIRGWNMADQFITQQEFAQFKTDVRNTIEAMKAAYNPLVNHVHEVPAQAVATPTTPPITGR